MSDPEKIAMDLADLCERHGMTLFIETNQSTGVIVYHLMTTGDAFARILDDWTPHARIH